MSYGASCLVYFTWKLDSKVYHILNLHGSPEYTLLIAKFVDVYGCTLWPNSSTNGCVDALWNVTLKYLIQETSHLDLKIPRSCTLRQVRLHVGALLQVEDNDQPLHGSWHGGAPKVGGGPSHVRVEWITASVCWTGSFFEITLKKHLFCICFILGKFYIPRICAIHPSKSTLFYKILELVSDLFS